MPLCKNCRAPKASDCICDDLNFAESVSAKARKWIASHSAVELANVATAKTFLRDSALQIELQSFALGALGAAMAQEIA